MKQREIDYLQSIGEDGVRGAFDKPFSHFTCSKNLIDLGLIMALLPEPPARLLDLGCGTGWTSAFFARRGYRVTGQDISPDMIRLAEVNRRRYAAVGLDFVVSDYEAMNFAAPFDCAVFYDSLHHAVDERAALASVYRALRPGGVLITHEPGAGHSNSPESIRAMKLYGVTEKDMPPSHIRELSRQLSYSSFKYVPDPTLAIIAVYGIDLSTLKSVSRPWLRTLVRIWRLFADRTLQRSGVCILTK